MARPRSVAKENWTITKNQGKFLRVITASVAKDVLRQEQTKRTFPKDPKNYVRLVDGSRKPEELVRFGGNIVYTQSDAVMSKAIEWIFETLVTKSPVGFNEPYKRYPPRWRQDHYYDAHVILNRNRGVIQHGGQDFIVTPGKRSLLEGTIIFVNPMPYARRMEEGATQYRRQGKRNKQTGKFLWASKDKRQKSVYARKKPSNWSHMAPAGVYRIVARMARARFGKSVKISYQRIQLTGLGYKFTHQGQKINQFYPSILVTPR